MAKEISQETAQTILIVLLGTGIIIWMIVEIVQMVVSAVKTAANFVIVNLGWIILGAVCLTLLIILFKWLKHKYIGKAEGKGVDPLLTKAAKLVVNGKNKLENESAIERRLSKKLHIGEDRARLLFLQLEYSEVLSDGGDSPIEVSVRTLWGLHRIFAEINAESDYFKMKIEERIESLREYLRQQIEEESGWHKQLLKAIDSNIPSEVALPYYRLLLATASSPDDKELAQEGIKAYEPMTATITVSEKSGSLPDLQKLYNDLSGTTIWDRGKRIDDPDEEEYHRYDYLSIDTRPFKGMIVNGNEYSAPHFSLLNQDLYLFPSFGILCQEYFYAQYFSIIDYKNVTSDVVICPISENSSFDVSEAEYYRTEWQHQRVNGGPDRRYNENSSEVFYKFYGLIYKELDLNIMCGKISAAERINNDFNRVFKSADSGIQVTVQYNQQIVPEKEDSQTLIEKNVIDKITSAIMDSKISADTVKNGTFVSILNDYQVFSELDDRIYAKILKAATEDGTLLVMATEKKSSGKYSAAYDKFVRTSGFDSDKISYILPAVATALNIR